MNTINWERLTALIDDCCLPPLSKPYDEYTDDYLTELEPHIRSTASKVSALIKGIRNLDERLFYNPFDREAGASLIVLLREMDSSTPWFAKQNYTEFRNKVTKVFMGLLKHFNIDSLSLFFAEMFDACMEKLHKKLTKDMWKRQIGALYCYRIMLKTWSTKYTIKCPLQFIFPGIFLQIDDFNDDNKITGMQCCQVVLRNMDISKDESGYMAVIYETLFKYIAYTEASIVSEALKCMMILLPVLVPKKTEIQWTQVDDVFEVIINNIEIADKARNKIYWTHMTNIMSIYGNISIRFKKRILAIITNALEFDLSTHLADEDFTFHLVALESWFKTAWQVWRYSTEKHLFTLMFKILFINSGNPPRTAKFCLVTMLQLCTDEQREEVFTENCVSIVDFPENFRTLWEESINACVN